MRVAIDARILPGVTGGVAIAVRSLVRGLGLLHDGEEQYDIIVDGPEQEAWFSSCVGPNQRIVQRPKPDYTRLDKLKIALLGPLARYLRASLTRRVWPEVTLSDGFIESLGGDVVHFPTQDFVVCALPSIYNPHDLQHLAFPQFFTPGVLAWRETVYPAGCHFSQAVVVGSNWVKQDLIRRYGIDPGKVQVIPEAAPTQISAEPDPVDLERVRAAHGLAQPFVFFPAVTWPHKNHLGLLRALAHLRDHHGLALRLVCTGAQYPQFWPKIEATIKELCLGPQVKFLGYVSDEDLRAIYRLASCLVLPSLYEASSLPIFEAWLDGLPVACSSATALPEQVADAASVFDPTDVEAIANALMTTAMDQETQRSLRARGTARLKKFDLLRCAKTYRALYRRTAGNALTEEDLVALEGDQEWRRES